jgi:hypothetical protein
MKKQKLLIILSMLVGSIAFTGCSSNEVNFSPTTTVTTPSEMIKTQNVEVFSNIYRLGVKHGCKTAKGYYEKDYYKYNNDSVYKEGWYEGMKQCRQKGKYIVAY